MAKLSGHQFLVLTRMARGDEIVSTYGAGALCFWHGAVGDRSPGWPTVFSLESQRLILNYGDERWRKYRITEAGRRALTLPEGGNG